MHTSTDTAAADTAITLDPQFVDDLVEDVLAAIPGDPAQLERRRRMIRATLLAARPADAMAATLVAQALTAHYAAMDAFRRAAGEQEDRIAARWRSNAAGLMRAMRASLRMAEARRPKPASVPRAGRKAAAAPQPQPTFAPTFAPVSKDWTLPRWETMTPEQRRAAYGYGEAAAAAAEAAAAENVAAAG